MKWTIDLSHDAEKFIARNHLNREEIFSLLELAIKKFQGETVNVGLGKLHGEWAGFLQNQKRRYASHRLF